MNPNFFEKYRKEIDDTLEYFIDSRKKEIKDEFLGYCYSLIKDYSKNGKRLRPICMMLSYISNNEKDIKKIIPAAISIELYHTYTLILDDLMDEDEFRRNSPTIYKRLRDYYLKNFGEAENNGNIYDKKSKRFCAAQTILFGNLTGSLSRLAIHACNVSDGEKIKTLHLMEKLDQWMCHGQSLDIYRENMDITEKDYIEIATLKTGVLFGTAMKIGALLAGKDEYTQELFFEAGKTMALAFQIQDDLLDLTTGKGHEIGSDIKKGKRTLIFIKAYEKNRGIKKFLGKEDIKPAMKIINETGAIDYSKKIALNKLDESKKLLKALKLNKEHEIMFSDLMEFIVKRNY